MRNIGGQGLDLWDEEEFLSPFGIRSLSRHHLDHPFRLEVEGAEHTVSYQPGESETGLFGGNSNWRGPIWLPLNFLLIKALRKFHDYYGDEFQMESPSGQGGR
jgi:glycogen debranching enzyme